ncbi:MAG: hypothetical protein J6R38_04405 [Alistipes sp.]|nr:hypothetical protein [Alistipes sp.]
MPVIQLLKIEGVATSALDTLLSDIVICGCYTSAATPDVQQLITSGS